MEKFVSTGIIGLAAMDVGLESFRNRHRPGLERYLTERGLKAKRPEKRGTGKGGTTIAWKQMNLRVAMALRHLQKRMSKV